MKKLILIILFSLNVFASEETESTKSVNYKKSIEMSEFDNPLLIGRWLTKTRYDKNGAGFNLNLFIASDYTYALLYSKNGDILTFDYGEIKFPEKRMELASDVTQSKMNKKIKYTYNKLSFGEIEFNKHPEMKLLGKWAGIQNKESIKNKITVKSLLLSPNYLFKANFQDKEGRNKEEMGIYVVEENRILFLYEDGQNIGTFNLEGEMLNIDLENGGLIVQMKRESLHE